jgi:hypothetical protein
MRFWEDLEDGNEPVEADFMDDWHDEAETEAVDLSRYREVLDRFVETIDGTPSDRPSLDELLEWMMDGVCAATDGCFPIEPDGHCSHGKQSWFLHLNLI